jgi:post-segregation antitoxin (ccd killing protein)
MYSKIHILLDKDLKEQADRLNINLTRVLKLGIEREVEYLKKRGAKYRAKNTNDILVVDLPAGGVYEDDGN